MITEAFPEDSGLFKCMALNPFGTVSCSAMLEVYNGERSIGVSICCFAVLLIWQVAHFNNLCIPDMEEQLENEVIRQQEAVSLRQEKEAVFQQEHTSVQTSSSTKTTEEFPPMLPDATNLPPPEWPDSPMEDPNLPSMAE